MKRGITLIELLMVMVLLGVIGTGLIGFYTRFVRETTSSASVAKDEQAAMSLLEQLLKDIGTIGFGMWRNPNQPGSIERVQGNGGNIDCNMLNTFAASPGFMAIANNCDGNLNRDELYFFSLAVRDFRNSGCWGTVGDGGVLRVESHNYLGETCDINAFGSNIVALDSSTKRLLGNVTCQGSTCTNAPTGTIVFSTGDGRDYPEAFAVRYFLGVDNNQPGTCAPGTFTLFKQVNGDIPQPIISCVGAFKVMYAVTTPNNVSYLDALPTNTAENLAGVRVCLLLQIGGEGNVDIDVPIFQSCEDITVDNRWRRYRWKAIEVDIPIRNR